MGKTISNPDPSAGDDTARETNRSANQSESRPLALTVRDATCVDVRPVEKDTAGAGAKHGKGVGKTVGKAVRKARRISTDATATDATENVTKHILFTHLDFDIPSGAIIDLTGPSGAGKSSLLTCMAQLNPRATATLTVDGVPAEQFTLQQWRSRVAYLPQKSVLPGDTVADAIRLPYRFDVYKGIKPPDDAAIRAALDEVGLNDIELSRDPHDLSGGQSARVSMIRTMLTRPRVLLADEVDAGLDDASALLVARYMARVTRDTGMAVVRVRHRAADGLETAVATLSNGTLVITPSTPESTAM